MVRILILVCLTLSMTMVHAQAPVEMALYPRARQLDGRLTTQRSLIVVSTPKKDNQWKEISAYVHKSFRLMGIDAVNYVHYLDYQASPTVQQAFERYADQRQMAFLILINQSDQGVRLSIIDRMSEDPSAWYTEGQDIREVIVNLAIALKRTDHINQNFLIPLMPEYLTSLPLYKGHRYPNYPDRIKRLKLAVFEIPEITPDSSLSPEQAQEVEAYNQQVRHKNEIIKKIAEAYPFKMEVLPMQPEDQLYQKGYQYVLYFLHTSAGSIRHILHYDTRDQTEYVSQLTLADGQRTLKTYASDDTVYKWYIKQVVVSDIHVGRYWDVHDDFETSLWTFVYRVTRTLQK